MKSFTVPNALQFTPSTAADGSTFTTPVFTLDRTGILTTTSYTGTLNTAAQPNITSLGTLVSTLGTIASKIINGSGQGTAIQYMELSNTGADVVFGIDNSAGGGLATNSTLYSGVIGTINARSFHLATSGIVRQTIDSAGNVVFTGTVTAANFVGPTTIDANNITGTTLHNTVIHSSLQDLGTLTALTVNGGFLNTGLPLFRVETNGNTPIGGSGPGIEIYKGGIQAYNRTTLANAPFEFDASSFTFIGGTVTAPSFTGNLTGTILTAAQGNITSLGTLTSLNVSAAPTFTPARTSGNNANALVLSDAVTGAQTAGFGTRILGSTNAGSAISAIGFETGGGGTNNETQIAFYTQNSAVTFQRQMTIDSQGRVLIGTTTTTGVAVGGIHVTGNSVFDGVASFQGVQSLVATDLTFSINGVANYWALKQATGNWSPITDNQVDIGDATHRVKNLFVAGAVNAGSAVFTSTVSGITTLTATSIFGTLATAAQTNITSLGQLTSLQVNGDTNINTDAISAGTGLLLTNTHASGTNWRIGENFAVGVLSVRHLDGVSNPQIANFSNSGITIATGSFIGNLTGNVTGNVTGTILTAAQANITSLGTLSALTVTGAITANGGIDFSGNVTSVVTFNTTGSLDFKDSVNNTTRVSVTSTGLTLQAGASLKNGANAVVTARQTGWGSPTATLSRTAVTNADSLATTISHLAALVNDLEVHGLIGA